MTQINEAYELTHNNKNNKNNKLDSPVRKSYFDNSPTLDLSIVVVSYNTLGLLRKCLEAIYSQANPRYEFEVMVVDNASNDDSAAMVRAEFPRVVLIENSDNRGFAAASNQALRQARGNFLLLLNPDTEVVGPALWQMLAFLEATLSAAVVGPSLQYANGDFQEGAFRFPSLTQIFLDFFPLNWRLTRSRFNGRYPRRLYGGDFPRAFEIDFPLGACLMLRRNVVEQVGLLDENFFMYMEEIDWCYRIKHAQTPSGYGEVGVRFRPGRNRLRHWKIFCLPAAKVIHHGGASAGQFREEMFYQLYKSRLYFYKKHYSQRFQFAARWLVRLGLLATIADAVLDAVGGRKTQTLLAQWRTYRRVWGLK